MNLLKGQLRGTNKILNLSKESRIPASLQELPASIHEVKDNEHPVCGAISYTVAALVPTNQPAVASRDRVQFFWWKLINSKEGRLILYYRVHPLVLSFSNG